MSYFFQQGMFVIRLRYLAKLKARVRNLWYKMLGMKIGRGTFLPHIYISWPNQVVIGANCRLEHNIHFKFDGIWRDGKSIVIGNNVFLGSDTEFNITQGIRVGDNALIASGCRFIDHDHGINPGELMRIQPANEKSINIGTDVWLGCNVVILKGVEVGAGAIVAAGAVVTKSVPPYEIWAGVPAKKIGDRK
jgi:acetyltransferase-like isoleucine patch superfamily enzyme